MVTAHLVRRALLPAAVFGFLALAATSHACFGTMLKVAVEKDPQKAYAAYAAGYFIAEKTGIEPDFIEVEDSKAALEKGSADLALTVGKSPEPKNSVARPAGDLPGFGAAVFRLRADVLEDIRFTTVEKALALCPAFFTSPAFKWDAAKGAEPRKAARKAVADGT